MLPKNFKKWQKYAIKFDRLLNNAYRKLYQKSMHAVEDYSVSINYLSLLSSLV